MVKRATDGDDEAERVLDTLDTLREWQGLAPGDLAAGLDRVLAVLGLDTPAVRTIVLANITGRRGDDWRAAYEEVVEDWRAAGVAP